MMSNDSTGCLFYAVIGVGMGIAFFALRPNESEMQSAVEAYGFTDAEIGEPSFLGCGSKDWYQHDFTATNSTGQRVAGVVCSSGFKQYTVRMTSQVAP